MWKIETLMTIEKIIDWLDEALDVVAFDDVSNGSMQNLVRRLHPPRDDGDFRARRDGGTERQISVSPWLRVRKTMSGRWRDG